VSSRRILFALLAATPVLITPSLARADDADPWWGRDKALHFGISVGLAAGSYGVSSLWLDERWQRAATAGGFTLTLGAGKEGWDAMGHGDPSWKDFTWDVAGAAVGTGLALLVDLALSSHRSSNSRAALRY
jgi:putative lipoprotein